MIEGERAGERERERETRFDVTGAIN